MWRFCNYKWSLWGTQPMPPIPGNWAYTRGMSWQKKSGKKNLQNINQVKYLHCPQGIFDFARLNREYLVGKEGTTRLTPVKSKRQHSKDNAPQLSRPKVVHTAFEKWSWTTLQHAPRVQENKPRQIPSFLLPKHALNRPKIMIKVKRWNNLKKDSQITPKKVPLVRQLGYSIYKGIIVLLILSHTTSKQTPQKNLRSFSTSNLYFRELASSEHHKKFKQPT